MSRDPDGPPFHTMRGWPWYRYAAEEIADHCKLLGVQIEAIIVKHMPDSEAVTDVASGADCSTSVTWNGVALWQDNSEMLVAKKVSRKRKARKARKARKGTEL